MDDRLAEAVAKRIQTWMETSAQDQRNVDYYRSLVVRCGEAIGEQAYIAGDGGKHEDVLCAKVPELAKLKAEPAKPWTPKPGDVVRLKSGGPEMTVTGVCINLNYGLYHACLEWFEAGRVNRGDASLHSLQPAKEGQP